MSSPAPGRDDFPGPAGRPVSRDVRRRERTPPLTSIGGSGTQDPPRPDDDSQGASDEPADGGAADAPAGRADPRSSPSGTPPGDDPLDPAPRDVPVDDEVSAGDVAVEDGPAEGVAVEGAPVDGPVDDEPVAGAVAEDEVDDDWDDDEVVFRRRPLWVTIPLHLVLAVIIVLDTWAAFAWSGGAGQLGVTLAAICASVALIFLVFLVTDARRHWPNAHNQR